MTVFVLVMDMLNAEKDKNMQLGIENLIFRILTGGDLILWNNCTQCKLEFRYKKLHENEAAETASSAQVCEDVAQGRAFVLEKFSSFSFSNFYQNHNLGSAWISPNILRVLPHSLSTERQAITHGRSFLLRCDCIHYIRSANKPHFLLWILISQDFILVYSVQI